MIDRRYKFDRLGEFDRFGEIDRPGELDRAIAFTPDAGPAKPSLHHPYAGEPVAGAAMVNRTRRVVRERARTLQVRKRRMRSLYIPLAVSAGLLATVVFAIWSVLLGYDNTYTGLPDSSQQIMVLLMWCLPVSAALLGVVWMRRAPSRFDNGAGDGRPQ